MQAKASDVAKAIYTNLSAVRCQWWDSDSYHFSIIAWCYPNICSNYSFLNELEAAVHMCVNIIGLDKTMPSDI
jgi:hypothetical protein